MSNDDDGDDHGGGGGGEDDDGECGASRCETSALTGPLCRVVRSRSSCSPSFESLSLSFPPIVSPPTPSSSSLLLPFLSSLVSLFFFSCSSVFFLLLFILLHFTSLFHPLFLHPLISPLHLSCYPVSPSPPYPTTALPAPPWMFCLLLLWFYHFL